MFHNVKKIAFLSYFYSSLVIANEQVKSMALETDPTMLRYQLITGLLAKGTTPLAGKKGCDFNTGQKEPLTIATWTAWNLSFFEAKSANAIAASCKEKGRSRAVCELNFAADAKGEDPWVCGFRFDITLPSYRIDLKSLSCIGTC